VNVTKWAFHHLGLIVRPVNPSIILNR